jgi:hypothetical protein
LTPFKGYLSASLFSSGTLFYKAYTFINFNGCVIC